MSTRGKVATSHKNLSATTINTIPKQGTISLLILVEVGGRGIAPMDSILESEGKEQGG